jgi:hypothetical protein
MRPDKKKTRHHDSLKCEAKAKEKAKKVEKSRGGGQKTTKEQHKSETKSDETKAETSLTGLNADAVDSKYSSRSVASNWTKYEIPSDDEFDEFDGKTGPDFNFVLENAGKSESLFQLKAEQEWEEKQNIFTTEFFALDMTDLEANINCISLPEQIGLDKSEFDVSYIFRAE